MVPCMACEAAHIEKTFKELLGCPEWIFSETVRYARVAKRKES